MTAGAARATIRPASLLLCGLLGAAEFAYAQPFVIEGAPLQKRVDAMLAVMGFQVVPDMTVSSLMIEDDTAGNPSLVMSQLGAGTRLSSSFPLFIEGGISVSRYDPVFLASNGVETLTLPVSWNSIAAGAGVGWEFKVSEYLKLRPIANFNIGYVASDVRLLGFVFEERFGQEVAFLEKGGLRTWGYGGALVLDYALYKPEYEIDVELRFSSGQLEGYGGSAGVQGSSDISNVNLWSRWRAPIGDWTAMGRPVRYLLEFSHSQFLSDDQRGVLGFDYLSTAGVGLELDSSEKDFIVTRTRAVVRYEFGENVSGWSLGFAVSF